MVALAIFFHQISYVLLELFSTIFDIIFAVFYPLPISPQPSDSLPTNFANFANFYSPPPLLSTLAHKEMLVLGAAARVGPSAVLGMS